jgi:hypothetical protein
MVQDGENNEHVSLDFQNNLSRTDAFSTSIPDLHDDTGVAGNTLEDCQLRFSRNEQGKKEAIQDKQ